MNSIKSAVVACVAVPVIFACVVLAGETLKVKDTGGGQLAQVALTNNVRLIRLDGASVLVVTVPTNSPCQLLMRINTATTQEFVTAQAATNVMVIEVGKSYNFARAYPWIESVCFRSASNNTAAIYDYNAW